MLGILALPTSISHRLKLFKKALPFSGLHNGEWQTAMLQLRLLCQTPPPEEVHARMRSLCTLPVS